MIRVHDAIEESNDVTAKLVDPKPKVMWSDASASDKASYKVVLNELLSNLPVPANAICC